MYAMVLTLQVAACGGDDSAPVDGSLAGATGKPASQAGSGGVSTGGVSQGNAGATANGGRSGGGDGPGGGAAGSAAAGTNASGAGSGGQSAGSGGGGGVGGTSANVARGAASLEIVSGNGCALPAGRLDFPELAAGHPVSQLDKSGIVSNGAMSMGVRVKVVCRWTTSKEPHGFDASIALGTNGNTVSIGAKGLAEGQPGQGNVVLDGPDLPGSYGAPVAGCTFTVIEIDAVSKSVWGKLTCPTLEDTDSGNSCALAESFFAFENCTPP